MHKPPFIRSAYNYDTKAASDATAIGPGEASSLTVQSMAEDADINVMMKRFGVTGKFPENPLIPTYQDFSDVTDFRTALHAIQHAHDAFMQYPADFRARFDNDPQNLLVFVSDPNNRDRMKELGLLKPEVPSVHSTVTPGSPGGSPAQGNPPPGGAAARGDQHAGGAAPAAQPGGPSGQAQPAPAV